jgi:cyclase
VLLLKIRIIPTLLYKDIGLVKGIGFNSWRRIDTVIPAIKVYNMREVDELILMDISATNSNREPDFESISEFTEACFIPLTVGGGIKNIEQIRMLLRSGADKVSINSALFDDLDLLRSASETFGKQCIVVSIDAKKDDSGKYYCYSHSGTKKTKKQVSEWAKEVENNGAGEIIITSIDRDGTMSGYDIDLIKQVTDLVNIPVIASGGAGSYEDFFSAIYIGKANAVAAASIFHFTEQTPRNAREYLRNKGINVRKTE